MLVAGWRGPERLVRDAAETRFRATPTAARVAEADRYEQTQHGGRDGALYVVNNFGRPNRLNGLCAEYYERAPTE